MKNIKDILFVIQARLGSHRVPGKMLRPFANTTLMDIAIEKILKSNIIPKENFYLSVNEKELVELGEKYNVNIFRRSEKSRDAENSLKDLYEWHDKLNFKWVIKINACNPLLPVSTIDNFVLKYISNYSNGLFAVISKKNYFWKSDGEIINSKIKKGEVMNTKIVETIYEAAHCLYAGKMSLIKEGIWMGEFKKNDPELFIIDEFESLDIDYEWQFKLLENIYKLKN